MLARAASRARESGVLAYIHALERARHCEWQVWRGSAATLAEQLVLCHPAWLSDSRSLLRGLGLVSFSLREARGECQSDVLWGYSCPLAEHPIQADHLFPSSLGGPAVGTNQVWLCQLHNQWKSSDLASYPWERGEPPWLRDQIARMAAVVEVGAHLEA